MIKSGNFSTTTKKLTNDTPTYYHWIGKKGQFYLTTINSQYILFIFDNFCLS